MQSFNTIVLTLVVESCEATALLTDSAKNYIKWCMLLFVMILEIRR